MIQVRRNCFETNSSSTHCLAVPEKNNIDEGAIRGKEIHFGLDYFVACTDFLIVLQFDLFVPICLLQYPS